MRAEAPHPQPGAAAAPTGLADLQRHLQAAILGHGDDIAVELLTASSRQSARERLAVYQSGYRLRLLGCLRSCFPALGHLLGPEAFDALAAQYLDAVPPRHYTLDRFSHGFPRYLADTRPDRQRSAGDRDPWVDMVVDLARFERAFTEVYDAWEPAAHRLLACGHPVHEYAAAVSRGEEPPPPGTRQSFLVLHRDAYTVVVTELSEETADRLIAASRARADGPAVRSPRTNPPSPPGRKHPGTERSR